MENESINKEALKKKKLQKAKKNAEIKRKKDQYFDFYDDIKRGSGKVIDW